MVPGTDYGCQAEQTSDSLLAPDHIESILDGAEPDGLSLEQVYRLPVEWAEQRRELGGC
jgi:hypothetical protein